MFRQINLFNFSSCKLENPSSQSTCRRAGVCEDLFSCCSNNETQVLQTNQRNCCVLKNYTPESRRETSVNTALRVMDLTDRLCVCFPLDVCQPFSGYEKYLLQKHDGRCINAFNTLSSARHQYFKYKNRFMAQIYFRFLKFIQEAKSKVLKIDSCRPYLFFFKHLISHNSCHAVSKLVVVIIIIIFTSWHRQ